MRLKRSCLLRQNQKKKVFLHSSLSLASASMGCHSSLLSSLLLTVHFICFGFELGWISPPALCRVRSLKSRGKQCLANSAGKCTSSDAALNALAADTLNLLWHRVWPSFFVRPNNYIRLNKVWPAAPPPPPPPPTPPS